jgi:hypothetical protein
MKKLPRTYAIARATSAADRSTCAWYLSANTFPVLLIRRFSARAIRTARPCSPRERRTPSGASTIRCKWLPCTEKCTRRKPGLSHPAAKAAAIALKHRRLRRFQTCGSIRHVTWSGSWRVKRARMPCETREVSREVTCQSHAAVIELHAEGYSGDVIRLRLAQGLHEPFDYLRLIRHDGNVIR